MPNKFNPEIEKYLLDLSIFLKDNANSERAEKEKAYLYSDLKHYGISSPIGHKFFIKHKKFLASLSKPEAIKLSKYLWSKPSFEEKTSALGILNQHLAQLDHTDMPMVEKFMRESKGWALLDSLIIPFMPTILQKNPKTYAYLEKWIVDKDYWVRRSALLAQLLFFRQGKGGKPNLFFKFAESQFDETWIDKNYKDSLQSSRARFFIRKAIGWTLREMSAKNPEEVVKFLNKNKTKMSGLSYREGSRKLSPKYLKLLCTS